MVPNAMRATKESASTEIHVSTFSWSPIYYRPRKVEINIIPFRLYIAHSLSIGGDQSPTSTVFRAIKAILRQRCQSPLNFHHAASVRIWKIAAVMLADSKMEQATAAIMEGTTQDLQNVHAMKPASISATMLPRMPFTPETSTSHSPLSTSNSSSSSSSSFPSSPSTPSSKGGLTTVYHNAVASTLGAAVVATVVTPLDVVKVRLQAHVCPVGGSAACEDPQHVRGTVDAIRKIVRADGVRGLWRGLNATLMLAIPTTGLYFTMYQAFLDQLSKRNVSALHTQSQTQSQASSPISALVAGASARVATATIASPLELARTTLQAGTARPDDSVVSVLTRLTRTQGLGSLWRGLGPTLLRDAPFSAIYWSVYETLKNPLRSPLPQRMFTHDDRPQFGVYLASGIGAGGLAALCTIPADVIKTRRQAVIVPTPKSEYTTAASRIPSSMAIAKEIISKEGPRGLFRGAGPRVAKVAPACAIMMGSFELFRNLLGGTVTINSSR